MPVALISNIGTAGVQYLATPAEVEAAYQHQIYSQTDLGTLPDAYYSTPNVYRSVVFIGQSNIQGRATGSVAGLPDAAVRMWMRSLDAGIVDPTALDDLTYRDNSGTDYQGPWAHAQAGIFDDQHHVVIVTKGGQSVNAWNSNSAGSPSQECIPAAHRFYACIGCLPVRCDIVIGIGETDAQLGTTKASYKSGLREMIKQARELNGLDARVHLVTLCDEMTGGGMNAGNRDPINEGITELADELADCYVIDMRAETGLLLGDNLHYAAAGNVVIWDKALASIEAAP